MRIASLALLVLALPLAAQTDSTPARGILIGANDVGLGIGDVPRVTGVRLNFRDRDLERVVGLNATLWSPKDDADSLSQVTGIALGLPLTGAGDFEGIGLAIGGIGAGNRLVGIAAGGLGVGAG